MAGPLKAGPRKAGPRIAAPRGGGPRKEGGPLETRARYAGPRSAGSSVAAPRDGPRKGDPPEAGSRNAGPRIAAPRGGGPRKGGPPKAGPRIAAPRGGGPRNSGPRQRAPDRSAARKSGPRPAYPRPQKSAEPPAPAGERIQKVLSASGVGSRRDIERWIREGRVLVNGEVPELGLKVGARDRITLDGRPVRVHLRIDKETRILLYHRSPGDALDLKAATSRAAEHLKLPRSNARWLAVQPLPPVDGGLEILTDDGEWAHRVSRGAHALTVDFVLRIRGPFNDDLLEELRAATEHEEQPMSIVQADAQYGEGQNHWLNVTARATRSAHIRHWLGSRGIIVSRLMRVRFGPVHLARELPRGHSRGMLAVERNALLNEVDAAYGTAPDVPNAASSEQALGPR